LRLGEAAEVVQVLPAVAVVVEQEVVVLVQVVVSALEPSGFLLLNTWVLLLKFIVDPLHYWPLTSTIHDGSDIIWWSGIKGWKKLFEFSSDSVGLHPTYF
jgi:hypothetical protein